MKRRPWLRTAAWLSFLGPFFFLTYKFANAAAARRAHVPALRFSWEQYVPFWAWTVLPYWSLDLLYGVSLPVCRTRKELDLHAKRLVAMQLFAVACFIAFPLRLILVRPPVKGLAGALFRALSFDRPFNQAPSLHVGLAVILWARYRAHTAGWLRASLAVWLAAAALSTLTTYQHHFIDLPTGLWAGLLVIAALPERRSAPPRTGLALAYLAGAVIATAAAFALRGFAWLLLWPGFALSMVSAAYWTRDPDWIGSNGPPFAWLLLPYSAGAWVNSRLWTRGEPAMHHVADGVWVGRAPWLQNRGAMNSVVNLAAELPVCADTSVPVLDLTPPGPAQLDAAVTAIGKLAGRRPTLVCCALGYSRSAAAVAAWLIASGQATNAAEAIEIVRRARPRIVAGPELIGCLEHWAECRHGNKD